MKRVKCMVAVIGFVMAGTLGAMAQNAPTDAGKPATPDDQEGVKVGTGSLTLNGLLQGWYIFTDSATPEDTFRLRRAEIKLSGEINPDTPWTVMIDPAQVREDDTKSSSIDGTNYVTSVGRKSVLQDALITFKLNPTCSFDIGQYKVPFGMEGLESSAKLDLIERSMLASKLKWADYRDIGITYKGNFRCPVTGVKIEPAAGVYNGDGQNKMDTNDQMAYAGRLVIKPVDALQLGVAHYNGEVGTAKTENRHTGGEMKFTMDPVAVYGEYATGESDGKHEKTYYVTAACKLCNWSQIVARYDWYDPDTHNAKDAVTETTIGLNYFIKKHNARVALNYVFVGEEGASVDNDIVRVLAQICF